MKLRLRVIVSVRLGFKLGFAYIKEEMVGAMFTFIEV